MRKYWESWHSAPDAAYYWHRRRLAITIVIHSLSLYLAGTEASGLYEARLGAEEMPNKEVHVFCAGYREDEFAELLTYADHIVFNSPSQLKRFGEMAKRAGKASVCASIRNIPRKRDMLFTIRVLRAAAWAQRVRSLTLR